MFNVSSQEMLDDYIPTAYTASLAHTAFHSNLQITALEYYWKIIPGFKEPLTKSNGGSASNLQRLVHQKEETEATASVIRASVIV